MWESFRRAKKGRGFWPQTHDCENEDSEECGKGRIQKANKAVRRPEAMEDKQGPAMVAVPRASLWLEAGRQSRIRFGHCSGKPAGVAALGQGSA